MDKIKKLVKEKLCKKGEAYRKRRMAAGEKSSAYLSGRAVKVCKGQMSGKKKANENTAPNHNGKAAPYGSGYKKIDDKIAESLRDWFKKENWVRINTSGNISGDCGTMKKDKATTRCLPKKKAQSMTKAERKATVAKKVRGSKKGKQFVSVNENFEMGDRVKLTPDYEETPGEVFTITQTSGNKYFIADEDGRGWYTYGDQLVMVDDELNESTHPYENKGNVRTFSKDVDPTSLVWHSDKEDRLIEVLEGEGWKLQLDNKLPLLLSKGDRIFINEGDVHRVIKGTTDLKIKING